MKSCGQEAYLADSLPPSSCRLSPIPRACSPRGRLACRRRPNLEKAALLRGRGEGGKAGRIGLWMWGRGSGRVCLGRPGNALGSRGEEGFSKHWSCSPWASAAHSDRLPGHTNLAWHQRGWSGPAPVAVAIAGLPVDTWVDGGLSCHLPDPPFLLSHARPSLGGHVYMFMALPAVLIADATPENGELRLPGSRAGEHTMSCAGRYSPYQLHPPLPVSLSAWQGSHRWSRRREGRQVCPSHWKDSELGHGAPGTRKAWPAGHSGPVC